MEHIRIRNLRSLIDTGPVAMKPITVLLGANSSGKSTFLRSFPLLRQSVETPTSSPVLWFGRYVDFGSIQTASNRRHQNAGVTFEFSYDYFSEITGRNATQGLPVTVATTVGAGGDDTDSRIKSISVRFAGHSIDIDIGESGEVTNLRVNDYKAANLNMELSRTAFFIPSISDVQSDQRQKVSFEPVPFQSGLGLGLGLGRNRRPSQQLADRLRNALRPLFHGNTKDQTISRIANRLKIGTTDEMLAAIKGSSSAMYARNYVDNMTAESVLFHKIRDAALANALPSILEVSDRHISRVARSITYMGPFRATAQRYYRLQDLAVREVDFEGENLGMFLRSLSDAEKRAFSDFSKTYFDFDVRTQSTTGHVEIRIRDHSSTEDVNLADVGFGFSQLIPVVAQVWSSLSRSLSAPSSTKSIVAIEQPELHLHPRFQAKIADVIGGAIKATRDGGNNMSFIIETHSEALVNRLGDLVRTEVLSSNDVQILIFTFDPDNALTEIKTATYDDDGALKDWPFGFFAP